MTIATNSLQKFCMRRCNKQHYVYYDHNDMSMIYINSDMTLLWVRKRCMIVQNKVLGKGVRLTRHPSANKNPSQLKFSKGTTILCKCCKTTSQTENKEQKLMMRIVSIVKFCLEFHKALY